MYRDNKLNIIICITIFFTFLGCKKELANDNKFIQNLSDDINFEIPMVNESLMIFVKKNDIVYITSLRQLYSVKEKDFKKFKDFDSFLIEVINNDLLSKAQLELNSRSSFKLNSVIVNEFDQKGINYLKDFYCENSKTKNKFYLKLNLELNIKQSVMYVFFKNNYYIMQNDYTGNDVLIDKNLR
ncbi:MAG: hypothetical protein ABI793_11920 [Flavobacterium sp.]